MKNNNIMKIDKQLTFDLQAVDSINLYFDNGKGWWGTVEFYQKGMKLKKSFHDNFETIQELIQAIDKFLKN